MSKYLDDSFRHMCQTWLTSLPGTGLRLKQNVPLDIYEKEGEYVAVSEQVSTAMSGESLLDAIQCFGEVFQDTFEFLDVLPEKQLGPFPKRQIAKMREYAERT
jgi:hypothetical protein